MFMLKSRLNASFLVKQTKDKYLLGKCLERREYVYSKKYSNNINDRSLSLNSHFHPYFCHAKQSNVWYSSLRGNVLFHTSCIRKLNPAVALVLRPLSKALAIVVGRGVRRWWKELPEYKRQLFTSHLVRNKWRYFGIFVLLSGFGFYLHERFITSTPYTGRKRLVIFDSSQIAQLSDFQFQEDYEKLKQKFLPNNHPYVLRTKMVCDRILRANRHIPQLYTKFWTVSVADIAEENCHVYPTGQIVMYKGMVEFTDNVDQLAIVLAHEISHAILEHTAELFTYATIIDLLVAIPLTLIWAFVPNDGVALVTHWFFKRVVDALVQLPYSRKLEKEADSFGLMLAASACFDVREASAFWGRLDLINKYKQLKNDSSSVDGAEIPFLSTHPSHSDRQFLIDQMMDEAIKERELRKCPKLSKIDPRLSVWALQEQFQVLSEAD